MDANTEIRKLRPAELYTLARILATSDSWKMLMAVVPKEGDENVPKFNIEHFALIEQASYQQRKSAAEIFLEEWSTMGRQRPTLQSTLNLLIKAELFRAADYIAVDLLKGQPPKRPTSGPAAQVEISDEEIAKLMKHENSEDDLSTCRIFDSKESLDSVLDKISYPSRLSIENATERLQQQVQDLSNEDNSYPHFQNPTLEDLTGGTSYLRLNPIEINGSNSNLIQFSKSDIEPRKNGFDQPTRRNNSNLIQFSSDTINSAKNSVLSDYIPIVLQQQNIPRMSSLNGTDKYSLQEKFVKVNISAQENDGETSTTFDTSEYSSTDLSERYVSNENNCNDVELQSSELPVFVADIGRASTSAYRELRSSELPQFVAEIAYRKSDQSHCSTNNNMI